MENIIKIFANEEFGRVRTVIIKGEPWFVLADVMYAKHLKSAIPEWLPVVWTAMS